MLLSSDAWMNCVHDELNLFILTTKISQNVYKLGNKVRYYGNECYFSVGLIFCFYIIT